MTDESLNRRAHTRESVEALAARFNTWGRWGHDDQLGAANRVTPDSVRAATALVRKGTIFSMALPIGRSGPQTGAGTRVNPQHFMLMTPDDVPMPDRPHQRFSDDAVYMPLQAATQWDGFPHVFYNGHTYNGRGHDSVTTLDGALFNSVTGLSDRAVARGVLLDVARWKGRDWLSPGECIQDNDLAACADAQGVAVREGDIALVRTGQLASVRATGAWGDYAGGSAPGLGVDTAKFLCGREVLGVATDTWGVETRPYESPDVFAPLHVILLVNAGVYLGEMWDMEALAEDCAADGVFEFLVVAPPLTITGAIGSPINPLAIK